MSFRVSGLGTLSVALSFVILACSAVPGLAAILRVPQVYPTIQAGLTAARAGDVVLVAPGRYFETLTMPQGVHIHGEPGAILEGSAAHGPAVRAERGVDHTAVLSGFVIRGSQRAGIFLLQAAPTIRNNVITAHAGPGIDCFQAAPLLLNNIITANAEGGIVCRDPASLPTIAYNDLWQNQPADAAGCPLGPGNRHDDPRFVDAVRGDYRLRGESPLIDAGDPDAVFNDADGSRNNIGAYGGPQPRPAPAPERFFAPPEVMPSSLGFHGLPGIINIPTATVVPSGKADLGYHTKRDLHAFPGVESEKTFNFAIGFLPWMTFGGRGTAADVPGPGQPRHISANVELLLLQEGTWWPSVALGAMDFIGHTRFFDTKYGVLSKTLWDRVRLTAGYGSSTNLLDGPFGGIEIAPIPYVTLLAEYDTHSANAGLRLTPPMPSVLAAYGMPRPTLDLIWQDGGKDFAWGVSLRHTLGEAKAHAALAAAQTSKRYYRAIPPADSPVPWRVLSDQLQAELIERGLENVRVSILRWPDKAPIVVAVEYENRRYNRDELHALGLVLGLAATRTPALVTHMSVIVKEVHIPVLQFSAVVDDYLAFINGEMSPQTFAQQVHITQQVQWPINAATVEAITPISNRSWLKTDVFLRPNIDTVILTEVGVAELRFGVLPDAFMQLTPGAVVNVRANVPVTKTAHFPGQLGDPEVDRVLVHQALPLPLGRWGMPGLTQFSLGRFDSDDVGIANASALSFLDGVLFFESTLAYLGPSMTHFNHWVALANGRVRYPPLDLTLSVTGGMFRDRDLGIGGELSRFFGSTEIGLFARHSEHGSLVGLRLAFPLTLAKELPPLYLRPRLPDLFTYEQTSTVFTGSNAIRNDISRPLFTGHEIERVYWNRDRLYPTYIRQHVDTLKQAARRWIDDVAENVSTVKEK